MNYLKRGYGLFFILLFVVQGNSVSANIMLPSVFSDNMVLQQNSEVAFWGYGNAGEHINIVAGWNTVRLSTGLLQFLPKLPEADIKWN